MLCYGSKKWRWSFQSVDENHGDQLKVRISKILNCWTENCFALTQSSHFSKVSVEEQKAQKEDRFLREGQIAYMIYDYFRVTGAHDTVLDYADFFSITLRNDDVRRLRYEMG